MERLCLLIVCFLCCLQVDAQFTQYGRTLEYHGRQKKTNYISPVSISFQGCSSTTNDKTGHLSLVFPNAKAGNVVSCTDLEISNSKYVVFNRNDFEIWTLGDRTLPIVLCEKSKIDNYEAIYTKVQMEAANAKYESKKKELKRSELDKQELLKKIEQLKREHSEEIKEIKENALIFAYIDEEKLDSLQYQQHLCILNNDIEGAVRLGKQIDFKNNMEKQLSNYEKSIAKTQELGLKLFQKAEALYLHITNCELLSTEKDSLREDYDILIKCYRTLLKQYPNNFKCTENLYNNTKTKLGNILYKYAELYLDFLTYDDWFPNDFYRDPWREFENNPSLIDSMEEELVWKVDSLTCSYIREASLYKNSKAILWIIFNGKNYDERKLYAKILLDGLKSGELNIPDEKYSYYDIKDICESFPDFQIEDNEKILYYSIISDSTVSVAHFYNKSPRLNKVKIPRVVKYHGNKYIVTQIGVAAFGDTSYEALYLKPGIHRGEWNTINNYFEQYNDTISTTITDSGNDICFEQDNDTISITITDSFSIYLPKTIEYIGAGAFSPRLSRFSIKINKIPNKLKILRHSSFYCCKFKKNIVIPDNIEIIEPDALPDFYSIYLPKSLKKLDCLNGFWGGNFDNSIGKIEGINNNPNFRMIDGALYTADSSYVYLGTVGHHNKRLNVTKNQKFDESFFERLHYTRLWHETEFIDSISIDERNPYYSYYDHCIYTKQLDTLLYILPSVDKVQLSENLKQIDVYDTPSTIYYKIPDEMSPEGLKECLEVLFTSSCKFELYGKEYKKESDNDISNIDFLDSLLIDNKKSTKLLCVKALSYLEDDKFYQASDLLNSIEVSDASDDTKLSCYSLLLDSCRAYTKRIDTYMEEYKNTKSSNHEKMVEICLKLRDYYNNTADYLNTELSIYEAFYINWVLGAQASYSERYNSLFYMEKGISYALKLVNEFDTDEYKNEVSDFYVSLANVALHNNDEGLKALQYANKSLELNPQNIEAYEALGSYFYNYGGVEKNRKIKELIIKVEKLDSNYSKSKDNLLYQLLSGKEDL